MAENVLGGTSCEGAISISVGVTYHASFSSSAESWFRWDADGSDINLYFAYDQQGPRPLTVEAGGLIDCEGPQPAPVSSVDPDAPTPAPIDNLPFLGTLTAMPGGNRYIVLQGESRQAYRFRLERTASSQK